MDESNELPIHPLLSVSEICTFPLSFDEELALWDDLGVRQVGVLMRKLDRHGREAAADALRSRGIATTTVIISRFDLAHPETWAEHRANVDGAIDLAADLGGIVYLTSGRRDGRSFDELVDALAAAVAPCVEYAASRGVRLALESTSRTDVSFVHTMRDGIDVSDRTGLDLVADIGNCWVERDYEDVIRLTGPRIAVVQLSDAIIDTSDEPGGRVVPGDGDLPVDRFIEATIDAGYSGPFELEFIGPRINAEGHAAATRRGVAATNALLHQVIPL